MPENRLYSETLAGLSFSLAELALARSWSKASSLRMTIRLDHTSSTDGFKELLAFHTGDSSICRWIMWRDAKTVFVQSTNGLIQRHDSLAEAFESLELKQPLVLTDIKAPAWPVGSVKAA